MPSTEAGNDLCLILTTLLAGLSLQLWLLFSSYCLLSLSEERERECADQQAPCFPLCLCSELAGLETCESISKFIHYCVLAHGAKNNSGLKNYSIGK